MSMTWLKLHHDVIHDIKLRRFTPQEKWAWIVLLVLASDNRDRGFISADDEDVADLCEFNSKQDWLYFRDKLIAKGMLEHSESGLKILNWDKRQHLKPSDLPEETRRRKRKQRSAHKAIEEAASRDVTPLSRPCHAIDLDTDLDPDTGQIHTQKEIFSVEPDPIVCADDNFSTNPDPCSTGSSSTPEPEQATPKSLGSPPPNSVAPSPVRNAPQIDSTPDRGSSPLRADSLALASPPDPVGDYFRSGGKSQCPYPALVEAGLSELWAGQDARGTHRFTAFAESLIRGTQSHLAGCPSKPTSDRQAAIARIQRAITNREFALLVQWDEAGRQAIENDARIRQAIAVVRDVPKSAPIGPVEPSPYKTRQELDAALVELRRVKERIARGEYAIA